MKDILDEIVAHKHVELEQMKAALSERELHKLVEKDIESNPVLPSLSCNLTANDYGIIAEFKRKSPSHGWIKEDGKPEQVTLGYQTAGAQGVSILTDKAYFGGTDNDIMTARKAGLTLPVLYKNFIVDEYQLFQARHSGASVVLLIAACLPFAKCRTLLSTAHEIGLEVLLEMHDERETQYAELNPDLCGINNRNLGTLTTTVENSFRLAELLPKDAIRVSESGISKPETVRHLRWAGYKGFLIGENFMKADNPGKALKTFINETNKQP